MKYARLSLFLFLFLGVSTLNGAGSTPVAVVKSSGVKNSTLSGGTGVTVSASGNTITLTNTGATAADMAAVQAAPVLTDRATSAFSDEVSLGGLASGVLYGTVGGGISTVSAVPATDANTASAIVRRDGSGNFSAGTITASLTGLASLNLPLAGGTMSGNIAMGGGNVSGGGTATFTTFSGALTGAASSNILKSVITAADDVVVGSGAATPAVVSLTASTILGKKSSGNAVALTGSEVRTITSLATGDSPTFTGLTLSAGLTTSSTVDSRDVSTDGATLDLFTGTGTTKTADFTAADDGVYSCQNAATVSVLATLPAGIATDTVRIKRHGLGPVLVKPSGSDKVNGISVTLCAVPLGSDTTWRYQGADGWMVHDPAVGCFPTSGLVHSIYGDRGISLSGSSVTTWAALDAVGNGSFTQGTGVMQPTWANNSFNGHPGVTFDGVADLMTIADAAWMDLTQFTWIAALKHDVAPATTNTYLSHESGATVGWHFEAMATGAQARIRASYDGTGLGPSTSTLNAIRDNNPFIHEITRSTVTNYAGTSFGSNGAVAERNVTASTLSASSGSLVLGASNASLLWFQGVMGGYTLYSRVLTRDEVVWVTRFWSNVYDLHF